MLKFLQCYLNVLSHIKITKAKFLFYSFCSFFKHKRNHALCIYTWTLLHATCFACFTLFLEKFSMSIYSWLVLHNRDILVPMYKGNSLFLITKNKMKGISLNTHEQGNGYFHTMVLNLQASTQNLSCCGPCNFSNVIAYYSPLCFLHFTAFPQTHQTFYLFIYSPLIT